MIGIPTAAGGLDKQSHEIIYKNIGQKVSEVPFLGDSPISASSVQRFTTSSKDAYCVIRDRLTRGYGRARRWSVCQRADFPHPGGPDRTIEIPDRSD
jgi:hypothetical protein